MRAVENIIKTIRDKGSLSFRDFMDMALYDKHNGYYTSGRNNIGKHGDYYTSPCLTSLFGAVLGKQIEEMWENSGSGKFTIVEYGAGDCRLCRDILEYLKHNKKLYGQLSYVIIEKNPGANELPEKVTRIEDIKNISGFIGCILSNELLDNFPVHRICMQDELMEVFVGYEDGFSEYLVPACSELRDYFSKWNIELPKGYHTEINLDAHNWIREAANALDKGYMITIDYGHQAETLYNRSRSAGTLMCYSKHQLSKDPYSEIGKRDITSHVNFSALCEWGAEYGLETCGLVNQANFLLALGFKKLFIDMHSGSENIASLALHQSRLNQLLLLEMGNIFKVLIQKKGIVSPYLTGINND